MRGYPGDKKTAQRLVHSLFLWKGMFRADLSRGEQNREGNRIESGTKEQMAAVSRHEKIE